MICTTNRAHRNVGDTTVVINAMHLSNNKTNKEQTVDENLNWIIQLLKRNIERPSINVFSNLEQKSL